MTAIADNAAGHAAGKQQQDEQERTDDDRFAPAVHSLPSRHRSRFGGDADSQNAGEGSIGSKRAGRWIETARNVGRQSRTAKRKLATETILRVEADVKLRRTPRIDRLLGR